MGILGVQLILMFFGLFMLYVSFLYWKRKAFTNKTFFMWLCIWIGFLMFSLFPNLMEPLWRDLFFVRAMDFGMIIAFMILTFLTIENNVRIKKYEEQLEDLVRKMAVKKAKKK